MLDRPDFLSERPVPQIGIKPVPPTLEVWSPNHWTTREVHAWVLDVILDFLHQPYTS